MLPNGYSRRVHTSIAVVIIPGSRIHRLTVSQARRGQRLGPRDQFRKRSGRVAHLLSFLRTSCSRGGWEREMTAITISATIAARS